ncbi:hypothetical protein A8V49_04630 [Yersinia pestis]|nr:hypothetical protein AU254_07200 [Yersinia pestis]KZB78141.1 hypothetical protein AVJ24_12705 [Yersinia pestis]PCN67481.1 hypothetical protein A8V49_04630 [Yersinia pestis]
MAFIITLAWNANLLIADYGGDSLRRSLAVSHLIHKILRFLNVKQVFMVLMVNAASDWVLFNLLILKFFVLILTDFILLTIKL